MACGAVWSRAVERLETLVPGELVASVVEDPSEGSYGTQLTLAIEGSSARVRGIWPFGEEVPARGQVITVRGRVTPLHLEEEWERRLASKGVVGCITIWRVTSARWNSDPVSTVMEFRASTTQELMRDGGVGARLLAGVLLGDKRGVRGTDVEDDFRLSGLSHILAVSGLHLGLMAAIASWVVGRLGAPLWARALVCVGTCLFFALITGAQISTVRALTMVCVVWLARLGGRRTDAIGALSVTAIVMLAVRPWCAGDVSFELSASAVGGLLLFGDLVTDWLRTALPSVVGKVSTGLAATLVAQYATLPVVCSTFGVLPIVGPIANLVAVPLLGPALGLGIIALATRPWTPGLWAVLSSTAGWILAVVARIASTVSAMPGAAKAVPSLGRWILVWAATILVLWSTWPRPRDVRRARVAVFIVVALSCSLLIPYVPIGAPRVVVMDVGQGDAIIVQDGGSAMLVDCGSDERLLRDAMIRSRVFRFEGVVLTHAHDDHIGGLSGLVGVASVGWVAIPEGGEEERWQGVEKVVSRFTPRGRVPVVTLVTGAMWSVGDLRVRCLWPPSSRDDLSENDRSVILLVSYGETDVLLTGDAEVAVFRELIDAGVLPDVEVLKVPHHGSENGLPPEAIGVLDPDLAIVSVGEGNDFGHPHAVVMEALRANGVTVLRTDLDGDVCVSLEQQGWRAKRQDGREWWACARIEAVESVKDKGPYGHTKTQRAQAGLSDPRRGRRLAGEGGQAAYRAAYNGGGRRFQPKGVRGPPGGYRGDHHGCQHGAVHV